MPFRIEPMTVEHLAPGVDVFVAAFTKPHRFPWRREDVAVRLEQLWAEPNRIALVILDDPDGTLTGFALGNLVQVADGPALRIGELCVHPARQGFGLGSRLLVGMETLARQNGAVSAYLMVQPDSVEFCQRLGYEPQEEWISLGRRLTVPADVVER